MAQTKAQLLGPVVGDVTIDTNTLSLDSESNKVGIGTASATTKLHVKDTFNTAYSLTNVADEANHILKLENASTTANAFSGMQFRVGSGADLFFGAIQQTVNHGDFFFANQNSPQKEMMRIKSTGLVGIGTDNPSIVDGIGLHIAGSSAGIKLQNTNNSDWAFIEYADETNTTKFIQGYRDSSGVYAIRPGTSLNAQPGITLISAGNVGIGTDNPAALLHLESTAANAAKLRIGFDSPRYYDIFRGSTTNSGYLNFYGSQSTFVGYIFDGVDGEWMRIKSNGKVGIGEDTPIGQLDIKGNVSSTTQFSGFDGLRIHNANGSAFGVTADMYFTAGTASSNRGAAIGSELVSGYGNDLYFATNGGNVSSANTLSERLRITSDGKVGIGYNSPRTVLEVNATHDQTAETVTPVLRLSTGTSYAGNNTGSALEFGTTNATYPTWVKGRIGCVYNGSSSYGGHLVFQTNTGSGPTVISEKMRITDAGMMGLGTATPTNTHGKGLHIADSNAGIRIQNTVNTGWAYMEYADESNTVKYIQGYRDVTGLYAIRPGNSLSASTGLTINSDGDIGINDTGPTRALSVNGNMNLQSGSRIESYSSGGNLIIQGGSTYPGGHLKMYGGTGDDKIEFCTSGQSASSTVRATLYDSGTLLLHDGNPSQVVNSNTKLEVRGPAIGNAGVDVDYFKGFKLSLDDATEWGGQVQHAVGRYEESGSSARTSYMISLGHGSLNSQSNADVNVMEMRSNGCVMTPGQPAFQATGFGSYRYMNTWQDVALSTWNFLDVNTGSHFNNSNGRFTAPVSGKYFFIYTTMFSNPSTNDFALKLHKNGSMIVISNNHSGGGSSNGHAWNDATVQAIINLVPGDYVDVRASGSNSSTCFLYGSTNSRYGTFSGFLIG